MKARSYTIPLPGMVELAPGVWRCPGGGAGAAFVGSARSAKFHRPTCWHARQIIPENRICFLDWRATREYGYVPCSKCKPLQEPPAG